MDIKLNFINQSNNTKNAGYVIFQKNIARGAPDLVVAWKLIKPCGRGESHAFTLPEAMSIGASFNYHHTGNVDFHNAFSAVSADPGDLFGAYVGESDGAIRKVGYASVVSEVQLRNDSKDVEIHADLYKESKIMAAVILTPQKTAAFEFAQALWIGVSWTAREGELMPAADIFSLTEIPLLGIASADIVATGGAPTTTGYRCTSDLKTSFGEGAPHHLKSSAGVTCG